MNRFRELLADEIRETAHRAAAYERAGATDLADWWRQRGRELCDYLEATSLALSSPSPGQAVAQVVAEAVTPQPSPALQRTG